MARPFGLLQAYFRGRIDLSATATKEPKAKAFRSVMGLEANDRGYFLFSLELDRLVGPAYPASLLAHE